MSRFLISLACLPAVVTCAANAQSSVTLFGVVDTYLSHGSGSLSRKTQLASGGSTASRLGFRGTEDMGGGMSASFFFDAGLNTDSGTGKASNTNNQTTGVTTSEGLKFNRRSTVSLSGIWGELRVGRDMTPQYRNIDNANLALGGGGSLLAYGVLVGPTSVRASNSVAYLYNTSGGADGPGLYGTLMYYMGENNSNAANKSDGNGAGLRVGYQSGPANVSLALSRTKYLAGDHSQNNIAVSWDFNVAAFMAVYEWDKNDAPVGGGTGKGYSIGVGIPFGADKIYLLHSRYRTNHATSAVNHPTSKSYDVGYIHNLSKRTAMYASYAYLTNSGGANLALNGATTGANSSSNGYNIGIRHAF
ncbi:porin [Variovorax boronicumulans]